MIFWNSHTFIAFMLLFWFVTWSILMTSLDIRWSFGARTVTRNLNCIGSLPVRIPDSFSWESKILLFVGYSLGFQGFSRTERHERGVVISDAGGKIIVIIAVGIRVAARRWWKLAQSPLGRSRLAAPLRCALYTMHAVPRGVHFG